MPLQSPVQRSRSQQPLRSGSSAGAANGVGMKVSYAPFGMERAQITAPSLVALSDFADVFEQIEHAQTECVGDDFHGVECRIGLTSLYPTKVGLIETAMFGELDLRQARCQTQLPYALPEPSC